jgi:hypothetical protein
MWLEPVGLAAGADDVYDPDSQSADGAFAGRLVTDGPQRPNGRCRSTRHDGQRPDLAPTSDDVMEWVETQLAQDVRLREQVEVRLNELRLERQLTTLREARGLSQRRWRGSWA